MYLLINASCWEDCFKPSVQLIKSIVRPKDFVEVTVTDVKKGQSAQNAEKMVRSASSHIQQR
jgi:hypothetical protein